MKFYVLLISLNFLFVSCSHKIPAEDISKVKPGKSFSRSGEYKIGPEDTIEVKVLGDSNLSGRYKVSPTGYINFPLVGSLKVFGQTAQEVNRKLANALSHFMKKPVVSVSIVEVKSLRVVFSGEFTKTGPLNLSTQVSILQGVMLAGGLTDFASGRIVVIRKDTTNVTHRYSVDIEDILDGNKHLDDFGLENDDIVYAE